VYLFVSFTVLPFSVKAGEISVSIQGDPEAFPLADCSVLYDKADYPVVAKTAEMLAGDLEAVTGHRPDVGTTPVQGEAIIMGTLGHSEWIDRLVSEGRLDVSEIVGDWERFVVRRLRNPFPGVEKALVIAGSDRRGTAYGAFSLSEAMGVSAWVWWADVPVKRQEKLCVIGDYVSTPPSVKYRGIFINDEDWGLKPWSTRNYEKELGDIGPKTYARVCELLLRLKANMMAPAMHACTGAFYSHPESKAVADEYGIILTTSHCEPLLFNNAAKTEWDVARDGEWDYNTNRETILGKLDSRVRETASFENIYTTGLRGLHDEGLRGNYTLKERVNILERAFADQRNILNRHLKKPAEEIPQIFVPYKETMALYEAGLKVPDDITLVWVDDNYGYIRRLGDPKERARSGGAGVYYHYSYLGSPHDYLWLCTTPPVLMYEEMKKAYDSGADRYWLLNVGDIKPAEMGIEVFFELAWDVKKFDYRSVNHRQSEFLAGIFGEERREEFQQILDTYYRLAWSRKPEYMGWEREWDDIPALRQLSRTEFSFDHYNDARRRLADYAEIAKAVDRIYRELPEEQHAAFFELLGYPVQGAFEMNRKFLMAQLSDEEAAKGNPAGANWAARQAQAAFDAIGELTRTYNTLLKGKWNGMMSVPEGFCAVYQNMPEVTRVAGVEPLPVDLAPQADQARLDGCAVIDIRSFRSAGDAGHAFRLLAGIGYDWVTLQLGEARESPSDPADPNGARVEYAFQAADAESVTVHVYTVPVFPLYKGRGVSFGISVDGATSVVSNSNPREYSLPWKDRVLRNGALATAQFRVDRSRKEHVLTLVMGDPGLLVQRIVIDWGGLKQSYVGPSL
jgi:hypothetical protein